MKPNLIVIDGKTYRSIDEMPADVRQEYEQAMRSLGEATSPASPEGFGAVSSEIVSILANKNSDGVPDMLQDMAEGNVVLNSLKIIVDGKEFARVEDLPPDARARYEQAMGRLDANRNGIPDFVEGMLNTTNRTANISTSFETEPPRHAAPLPVGPSPTIEPDTSSSRMLVLSALIILLLCVVGAAGLWYFFLR